MDLKKGREKQLTRWHKVKTRYQRRLSALYRFLNSCYKALFRHKAFNRI